MDDLQGTGNALLANHQEMEEHKYCQQPREYEGMQAVVASEGALTDTGATPEEFHNGRTDDGNGFRDTRNDFNGPVTNLVPRQRVAGDAERYGDDGHNHTSDPGQLAGFFETAGEVHPEDVENHHQHHHAGRPAVNGADQPAEVNFVHNVLNRVKGFGDGGPIVEGHSESSGELDQEADESDPAQAVKDVDVGGDVFGGDVVSDRLNF